MPSNRFKPKGDQSRKITVVELAATAGFGELLTYHALAMALQLQGTQDDVINVIRGAVSAARPMLIRDHGRVLIAQRGEGYRVGKPGELAGLAQSHRGRADRQVQKALAIVTHGDTRSMSPEEYTRFQATKTIIVGLHTRMTNMEDRMAKIEEAVFGPQQVTPVVKAEVIDVRPAEPHQHPETQPPGGHEPSGRFSLWPNRG